MPEDQTIACIDASDPAKMLFSSPHSFEQKKALYDTGKAMIEHLFVAASLNRASTDYWTRLATSMQSVEVELCPFEEQRIANMEEAQISISAKNFMSKGCVGILDDDLADLHLLVDMLKQHNYTARSALGGSIALQVAQIDRLIQLLKQIPHHLLGWDQLVVTRQENSLVSITVIQLHPGLDATLNAHLRLALVVLLALKFGDDSLAFEEVQAI
jgi:hypothetical protein